MIMGASCLFSFDGSGFHVNGILDEKEKQREYNAQDDLRVQSDDRFSFDQTQRPEQQEDDYSQRQALQCSKYPEDGFIHVCVPFKGH